MPAGLAGVYAMAGSPLAVLGLQVLFTRRRSWWLIALQAAAYGSMFVFDTSVGTLGFVAGSLLLATVLREAVTEIVRRRATSRCVIESATEDGTVRLNIAHDGTPSATDEFLADLPAQVAAAGGTLTTGVDDNAQVFVEVALPGTTLPDPPALSSKLSTAVLVGFSAKALLLAGSWWPLPLLVVIIVIHLRSIEGRHPIALIVMGVLTLPPSTVRDILERAGLEPAPRRTGPTPTRQPGRTPRTGR
ncbi:hypothetical protein [Nonomuraea sp. NPDC001699]